ncbi:MAG: DUF2490 domain-containing protein [Gammaproteobacteria bacterium]|nr:DUF2490 domain-containing protein [Gammaproteobacteria bacterium]
MNLSASHHTTLHRTVLHLILFFTAAFYFSTAQAAETGSSHNLFYLNKLNDKAFFVGRANLVTRDGFSDTFFGYVDANYRYTLSEPWAVEVGYRHAFLELGNQWREEYRPMLSLYWRGKLAGGKFSNRSRIEWRYFEGNAQDRLRYRNESVWTSQNTITDYQLTPFIEEEFFYDITSSELNINWLTFGVSKFWRKGVKWKLGYRLQSQKFNNQWENRHTLVTGISIFH